MKKNVNKQRDGSFQVCLFGALLDVDNLGCRALTVSLIALIRGAMPSTEVRLHCGNRTAGIRTVRLGENEKVEVELVNHRLSPKSRCSEHLVWIFFLSLCYRFLPLGWLRHRILNANKYLRSLKQADLVADIRGGDSFSDIYGFSRFFWSSLQLLPAILLGQRLVFLPQTYGPYKSWWSRLIARFLLRRARLIMSRDREGMAVVRRILGRSAQQKDIMLCPDVAFALPAIAPEEWRIEPPIEPSSSEIVVGINISGLLYIGGYSQDNMFGLTVDYPKMVKEVCLAFLKQPGVRVVVIPHSFGTTVGGESDLLACREVYGLLSTEYGDRIHLAEGPYDQNEVKAVIGRCDFFLGARMHACIAALSQSIPAVGLAYSRKFLGIFDTVGCADMVVDIRETVEEEVIDECLNLFLNREQKKTELTKEVVNLERALQEAFSEVVSTKDMGRQCSSRRV